MKELIVLERNSTNVSSVGKCLHASYTFKGMKNLGHGKKPIG
jgi:hypothetical protein